MSANNSFPLDTNIASFFKMETDQICSSPLGIGSLQRPHFTEVPIIQLVPGITAPWKEKNQDSWPGLEGRIEMNYASKSVAFCFQMYGINRLTVYLWPVDPDIAPDPVPSGIIVLFASQDPPAAEVLVTGFLPVGRTPHHRHFWRRHISERQYL